MEWDDGTSSCRNAETADVVAYSMGLVEPNCRACKERNRSHTPTHTTRTTRTTTRTTRNTTRTTPHTTTRRTTPLTIQRSKVARRRCVPPQSLWTVSNAGTPLLTGWDAAPRRGRPHAAWLVHRNGRASGASWIRPWLVSYIWIYIDKDPYIDIDIFLYLYLDLYIYFYIYLSKSICMQAPVGFDQDS